MPKKTNAKKQSGMKRASKAVKIATVAAGLGAVIGATAALFSAPKRGSELARDVSSQTKRTAAMIKKRSLAAEREFEQALTRLSPSARRSFDATKRRLAKQIAASRKRLTKADYHDMVESAFKKISAGKQGLAHEVKSEWKRSYTRLKKYLS
jgi:gas vesicle protein